MHAVVSFQSITIHLPCNILSSTLAEPDDYGSPGFPPGQPGMDNLSNILRRQPTSTVSSSSFATATSAAGQPPFSFTAGAPSATQGMPSMPFSQVTVSQGVGGVPATFTNLNTMNPALQQTQVKNEQPAGDEHAQSLMNETTEEGSACNSLNFDSGLFNFVNDTFPVDSLDQNDSLTNFLNGQEMDSSAAGAGNLQQDLLMNQDLQDIHQKIAGLNQ